MRLHRLDLTAFGPYPRHELVDFDALGADGLFLLHGDTGAGKTTVLDAVAYALFGSVPGARGEVKRLRCDYADRDTVTEVVLEFTVQGHRLRLVRRPEYERPKRGGAGVTMQRAKASLTWVGDAPSGHAPDGLTRLDEVGRTVQRLLGMSAEQFFQVVLLPQGDFARFLRADTAERELLLERLFGTQRFADVERWFRDTRTARGQAVHERQQAARELVARVAQAAGEEPPTRNESACGGADRGWLTALRARLADTTSSAAKQETVAHEEHEVAARYLVRQRERADRIRRVRAATGALADLAANREQRESWHAELAAARRAVPVLAAQRAADLAEGELLTALRTQENAANIAVQLGAVGSEWSASGDGVVTALRLRGSALRDEAGALHPLVAEAERQCVDQSRLVDFAERERTARELRADLLRRLTVLPGQVDEARAELDAAVRAAERVDGLAANVAELDAVLRDAELLPSATADAERARRAATAAVDRHLQAREVLLDVRQRRLDGMAAELAGGLAPGAACVVCGSVEHPAPAAVTARPVVDVDERVATEAEQAAQRGREEAAGTAQRAEHDVVVLRERVGNRTVADLSAALGARSAELREAQDRAARVAAQSAALARLGREVDAVRTRLGGVDRQLAAIEADRAALDAVVSDRAERLVAARDGYPDVAARRAGLLAVAESVDSLAAAVAARLAAESRRAQVMADLTGTARRAGFATPEDALAVARPERAITDLADALADADRRAAAAETVLAEPDLAGIRPDAEVDVELAVVESQLAESEARGATVVLRAAQRREQEVSELAERVMEAWIRLEPIEAQHREFVALAEVVNGRGQNARRMSLRSYVLAARLAEVAAAATQRLQQMSQGRYSFVHSEAAGPRGTRGGLGIDVLDDYSGLTTPAKTLSGGESFLASLSLALGLADVVAAEAGGVLLDTLFVDEGFGTLDADALDQVMNTLDELRAGGRVVGVVSHVEELRQRIPVRLHVRKARSGSVLDMIAG